MKDELIHKKLSNGLNIYFCPLKNKHSVVIDLIVKYGGFYSDFTSENINYHINDGMAHLLEHLIFEKNPQGRFNKIFGDRGMFTNAYTWPFITEYFVDTVEDVDYALENLIKGVSTIKFTEEDINVTKPPIYQEIKMRQDEIGRKVLYKTTNNTFKKIPYVSGLGTIENVKSFTYDEVKLCYDTFYQPKNEILFISGNIDVDEMYEKIKKIYSKLEFKNIDFSYKKYEEVDEVVKEYDVIHDDIKKDYVSIWYKINLKNIPKDKWRMYTYYLDLFRLMNFSDISPLHKTLMDEKIVDNNTNFGFEFYDNYLLIKVSNYVNDEEKFISNVRNTLENDRNYNDKVFNLYLKDIKTNKICYDPAPTNELSNFVNNLADFDYPDFDSTEEINALNSTEYKEFINSLEFKNYTITKVTK
jgi:predicted Zn-dependent peptidase